MQTLELSIEKTGLTTEEVDILMAFMLDAGFESFAEDDKYIRAYIPGDLKNDIPALMKSVSPGNVKEIIYTVNIIAEKNWNEQWEKNFTPIVVENRILVKAPFHNIPDLEYTINIEPKMSFGTGHHETTRLMLREMLHIEITGKEVLDMGCGTGVLGIAAKLMGASYVLAVDNDDWAFQNAGENYQRNNISQPYDVYPGDCSALEGHTFHLILANINRNVLLNDMPEYKKALKEKGILILSGILSTDKEVILKRASELGFNFVSSFYENNWISLNLRK